MTKVEVGKKAFLIAGIFFTVRALYAFVLLCASGWSMSLDWMLWYCFAMFGMATALYMKNRKIAIIAAGVTVLSCVPDAFRFLKSIPWTINEYGAIHETWQLLRFLELMFRHFINFRIPLGIGYISVVLLIVLSFKKYPIIRKVWFVPATLLFIYCAISLSYGYSWKLLVIYSNEVAALFFAGMWLKEYALPVKKKPAKVHTAPPTIGGADNLKMYKELLDSGVITQEEFDAKKKQILRL